MEEMSIPHQPFYLIRHGETDWNVQRLITGQQDILLNQRGHHQASKITEILCDKNITQIFSSSLRRTKQTADIINKRLNLPLVYRDDLIERGWGENEGQPHSPETSLSTLEEKDLPKGAESYADFQRRIITALRQVLHHSPGIPLIVAHGGVFVTLIHFLQHMPLHIHNCLPYLFTPPQEVGKLWTFQELKSE